MKKLIPLCHTASGDQRPAKVVLHHGGRFSVRLNRHWQRELDRLELPVYRQLPPNLRRRVMRHIVKWEIRNRLHSVLAPT